MNNTSIHADIGLMCVDLATTMVDEHIVVEHERYADLLQDIAGENEVSNVVITVVPRYNSNTKRTPILHLCPILVYFDGAVYHDVFHGTIYKRRKFVWKQIRFRRTHISCSVEVDQSHLAQLSRANGVNQSIFSPAAT